MTLVFLSSFQNLKQLVWPGYETITRIATKSKNAHERNVTKKRFLRKLLTRNLADN